VYADCFRRIVDSQHTIRPARPRSRRRPPTYYTDVCGGGIVPPPLVHNRVCGFANIDHWTDDAAVLAARIHAAFQRRWHSSATTHRSASLVIVYRRYTASVLCPGQLHGR
jgi:hypothetical protein